MGQFISIFSLWVWTKKNHVKSRFLLLCLPLMERLTITLGQAFLTKFSSLEEVKRNSVQISNFRRNFDRKLQRSLIPRNNGTNISNSRVLFNARQRSSDHSWPEMPDTFTFPVWLTTFLGENFYASLKTWPEPRVFRVLFKVQLTD